MYRDYNFKGYVSDFPKGTILRYMVNEYTGFLVVSPGKKSKADFLFGLDMNMGVSTNICNKNDNLYERAPITVQIAFLSILQDFQRTHPEAKLTFDCEFNLIKCNLRKYDNDDKKFLHMNDIIFWGYRNPDIYWNEPLASDVEIIIKNIKIKNE